MRTAVVLASAPGALDELAMAPAGAPVLAVNAAGITYLGPVYAWGSVHGDQLEAWHAERLALGGNAPTFVFGESFLPGQRREPVGYFGPVKWMGSSALYVVQWALAHGFDRLALAGVHLSGDTRQRGAGLEPTDGPGYDAYRGGWLDAFTELAGKVRSYGGWTADLLGTPGPDFWRGLHGKNTRSPSCGGCQ